MTTSPRLHRVTEDTPLDTAFLDTWTGKQDSTWFIKLQLEGQEVEFKMDTGAEVTAFFG